MKIFNRKDAQLENRPAGKRWYFDFPEYELHLNEIKAGASTDWHHHEIICETVFVVSGEFTVRWRENGRELRQIIIEGDVVEVGNSPQSFFNHTDKTAIFLDIKQLLSGQNKQNIFKSDKVKDE